jgi:signal peptidase II
MLKKSLIIIFLVLLFDQGSKIWIKTNMHLGQEFNILGDWFIIHFTENNGMAFGMEFAGEYGKLFLSVFRIFAISLIGWYLFKLIKEKANPKLIISISFVFAGAVGNILDSIFYGVVFGDSYNQVAAFLPADGGYSKFLYGKVVDMLYFPLVEGYFPDWLPFWGGEFFMFFRPVFNVADSAITIGIAIIIIFQSSIFEEKKNIASDEQLDS